MSFKYHIIILAGFSLLASCSELRHISKDVDQMRKQLPQIQLPATFNSDKKVKYRTIELEGNQTIKRLIDKNSFSLLGKLFETENNITILGYLPDNFGSPVVITIDNNGNEISSHVLFETARTGFGYHTSNYVMIRSNRYIMFMDSSVLITKSTSVTHKSYVIKEDGTIEVVN